MKAIRRTIAAGGLVLLTTTGAGAQSLATGVQFEAYRFDQPEAPASVRLLSVPLRASMQVGSRLALSLSSAWGEAVLQENGADARIHGPTDTQISATLRLASGQASVTGIVSLPTGHSSHTAEEAEVAGVVASDLILFRVSNWGTGGGAGIRAAASQRWGAVGAGLGVGYFVGQDFNPADQRDFSYRPGNNFVLRAAFDAAVGRAGKASLQLTFRKYEDDQLDGANLYRSGDRLQAIGSYSFAAGRTSSAVVYAGALHRTEGVFFTNLPSPGGRTFLIAGGGGRVRIGAVVLLPAADLRALRREDGLGQGFDGRVGASLEWTSGATTFVPSARFHVGRVSLQPGIDSRFVGTEVGLAVRFGKPARR